MRANMAERLRQRGVSLEYAFDRLFNFKLQQVYELLVPDHARVTGEGSATKADSDEECSDLRSPSLLYAAEGGAHHCQPDGGPEHRNCDGERRRSKPN